MFLLQSFTPRRLFCTNDRVIALLMEVDLCKFNTVDCQSTFVQTAPLQSLQIQGWPLQPPEGRACRRPHGREIYLPHWWCSQAKNLPSSPHHFPKSKLFFPSPFVQKAEQGNIKPWSAGHQRACHQKAPPPLPPPHTDKRYSHWWCSQAKNRPPSPHHFPKSKLFFPQSVRPESRTKKHKALVCSSGDVRKRPLIG